jgi:hypothetical protein
VPASKGALIMASRNCFYVLKYNGLYFTPRYWAHRDPTQTFKTKNLLSSKKFATKAGAQKFLDQMHQNAKYALQDASGQGISNTEYDFGKVVVETNHQYELDKIEIVAVTVNEV